MLITICSETEDLNPLDAMDFAIDLLENGLIAGQIECESATDGTKETFTITLNNDAFTNGNKDLNFTIVKGVLDLPWAKVEEDEDEDEE